MANLIARQHLIAVLLMTVGRYIRIYWSDVKGASYVPVGYTPILRASGQRFGCNMIPAITPLGGMLKRNSTPPVCVVPTIVAAASYTVPNVVNMMAMVAGASWRRCYNASGPLRPGIPLIEQHMIEEAVLQPLQQRFTRFIPNDVMALPNQPFGDGRVNRRLIIGQKDC